MHTYLGTSPSSPQNTAVQRETVTASLNRKCHRKRGRHVRENLPRLPWRSGVRLWPGRTSGPGTCQHQAGVGPGTCWARAHVSAGQVSGPGTRRAGRASAPGGSSRRTRPALAHGAPGRSPWKLRTKKPPLEKSLWKVSSTRLLELRAVSRAVFPLKTPSCGALWSGPSLRREAPVWAAVLAAAHAHHHPPRAAGPVLPTGGRADPWLRATWLAGKAGNAGRSRG